MDQLALELSKPVAPDESPQGPLVMTIVTKQNKSDLTEDATSLSMKTQRHELTHQLIYAHRASHNLFIPVRRRA